MYFQKWKLSLSTQSCIILFTKIFLLLLPLFIFYSLLTFTSFLSCFLHLSPSLHNPVFFFTSLSFLSLFLHVLLLLILFSSSFLSYLLVNLQSLPHLSCNRKCKTIWDAEMSRKRTVSRDFIPLLFINAVMLYFLSAEQFLKRVLISRRYL